MPTLIPQCLRAPQSSDYEELVTWIPDASACQRWAGSQVPYPLHAETLPQVLTKTEPGFASYSAINAHGALCGFGQHWLRAPDVVHVGRIIVAPHGRGQGWGQALFALLVAAAVQATGAPQVTLRVYRDNAAAITVYRRWGFREVPALSEPDVMLMAWRVPVGFPEGHHAL